MKLAKLIFPALMVLITALFSVGCKNAESTDITTESSEIVDHHDEEAEEMTDLSPIELNNGEKWAVNEEMKPFIDDAEKLLSAYIKKGDGDFHSLAEKLREKNQELIKSCTMEGKSHQELHKWLEPHLELVDELTDAQDAETANAIIAKLSDSYKLYNQYFD